MHTFQFIGNLYLIPMPLLSRRVSIRENQFLNLITVSSVTEQNKKQDGGTWTINRYYCCSLECHRLISHFKRHELCTSFFSWYGGLCLFRGHHDTPLTERRRFHDSPAGNDKRGVTLPWLPNLFDWKAKVEGKTEVIGRPYWVKWRFHRNTNRGRQIKPGWTWTSLLAAGAARCALLAV